MSTQHIHQRPGVIAMGQETYDQPQKDPPESATIHALVSMREGRVFGVRPLQVTWHVQHGHGCHHFFNTKVVDSHPGSSLACYLKGDSPGITKSGNRNPSVQNRWNISRFRRIPACLLACLHSLGDQQQKRAPLILAW